VVVGVVMGVAEVVVDWGTYGAQYCGLIRVGVRARAHRQTDTKGLGARAEAALAAFQPQPHI